MYGYEYQVLFGGRVPEDVEQNVGNSGKTPMDENGQLAGPTSDGRSFGGPLDGISGLVQAS